MIRRLLVLPLLLAWALVGCAPSEAPGAPSSADAETGPPVPAGAFTATVERISDGDTLWVEVAEAGRTELEPGERRKLRLLRIDTPELARGGRPAECLAEAARDELARLAPPGTTVRGAYDVERQDRFGRDLVHLWTGDGVWVNGAMLASGHAAVVTFPPNVAYDDEVRDLERTARESEAGLWNPARC